MTSKKTQSQKLMNYLTTGKRLTAETAEKRFGTKNLRARINDFRKSGLNIVTEQVTNKGEKKTAYRLV